VADLGVFAIVTLLSAVAAAILAAPVTPTRLIIVGIRSWPTN
jgi:hypothetical protein